jgi:hypothetical protein
MPLIGILTPPISDDISVTPHISCSSFYLAITSTYLPFFFALAPPALLLGAAGPSKSSISLTLFKLEAGLV